MIVAVHQPQYLPWLGYFDKMRRADVFCYLNDVQYKKNEWQNRNRIKTARGWQWLTVPVRYHFPEKINEVKINNTTGWQKKHLQALVTNYSRAPFYKTYSAIFEETFAREWEIISELNIHLLAHLREALGINAKPTVISSDLKLREEPTDRLIDICKAMGADTYLAGQGGADYMDLERFENEGIQVIIQDFKHPVYAQLFEDFEPYLSIVDLLFNCGPESLQMIERANEEG
ncbi:MAG: WbqC family protein [Deltaproteobacteria bacterium]|nr:WbqC family protein [Deltaproteobacteria bacterium]